jgi:hypothetical protein
MWRMNRFATHWKWVLMLIIIFVAMILGLVVGLWLKRRYRRKKDAAGANMAARDAYNTGTEPGTVANNRSQRKQKSEMTTVQEAARSHGKNKDFGITQPPPAAIRSRSGTVDSRNDPIMWAPHPDATSSRRRDTDKSVSSAGDLPERTYSPILKRGSRPGTAILDGDISVHPGDSDPRRIAQENHTSSVVTDSSSGGALPRPSPPKSRHSDGAGAQRIREMRSLEQVGKSSSPLSRVESVGQANESSSLDGGSSPAVPSPVRLSKRLSKKK